MRVPSTRLAHRLERFRGRGGLWYWRAVARNGRVVDGSEQGYRSKWWAGVKAKRAYPYNMLLDR